MIELGPLAVVRFQFMYMTRSPLRVGEKFLDKLVQNIQDINLEHKELENSFLAVAIKAFGSKPDHRRELCSRAPDALEILGGEE